MTTDPTLNLAPELVAAVAQLAEGARRGGYSREAIASALIERAAAVMEGMDEPERREVAKVAYRAADWLVVAGDG